MSERHKEEVRDRGEDIRIVGNGEEKSDTPQKRVVTVYEQLMDAKDRRP